MRLKKITITLDADTAARTRAQAAASNMSVSRYVGEVLRRNLAAEEEYWAAYRAWREEEPLALKGPPKPYPKREELYGRPVHRRR